MQSTIVDTIATNMWTFRSHEEYLAASLEVQGHLYEPKWSSDRLLVRIESNEILPLQSVSDLV